MIPEFVRLSDVHGLWSMSVLTFFYALREHPRPETMLSRAWLSRPRFGPNPNPLSAENISFAFLSLPPFPHHP